MPMKPHTCGYGPCGMRAATKSITTWQDQSRWWEILIMMKNGETSRWFPNPHDISPPKYHEKLNQTKARYFNAFTRDRVPQAAEPRGNSTLISH